jgi:DegV family protein with EDD domain
MNSVCILTDSTAQFPTTNYEGSELISVIAFQVRIGNAVLRDTRDPRHALRMIAETGLQPILQAPSVDEFVDMMKELAAHYQAILVILTSENLCPIMAVARQAAEIVKGATAIFLIDSQTTGPGLGMLVMKAARLAKQKQSAAEISRVVRGLVPHVFSAYCLQNLRTMANANLMDPAQAVVGEMLNIIPFYVMENGKLVPVQKARNHRQMVDLLHEFASEFDHLQQIAVIQGVPPYEQEMRNLRDRLEIDYPDIAVSEYVLSASLLSLLGARSIGVVAMEVVDPS